MSVRPSLNLRPLVEADGPALRRIYSLPEIVHWWDEPKEGFPMTDEPEATRQAIEIDGQIAGLIQFSEETEPKYRHASIDIFLDPQFQGQGFGTEALQRMIKYLVDERGHHRITIDPATANAAAIRAYEKAGFNRVGIMRKAERDADSHGWHDCLLMEYVINPS